MKFLSNKEKRNLINRLESILKVELNELKKEEIIYDEKFKVYISNKLPIAFEKNDELYPTIFLIAEKDVEIPHIIVNDGAKERILNGADVFRPGIIEFSENIKKGDIVLILSKDNEILGIGISLMDYNEIKNIEKGKVIENVHYFGDKITEIYKSLNK